MSKPKVKSNRSPPGASPRVLFINRSYWPDAEATGQLLTELCEDLAPSFDVTVIAGQPNGNPSGESFRRRGTDCRNGVRVRRVWHTRFAKRRFLGRIVNYLSFLWGAFWAALWMKRPDVVVVETDPPLLSLIGWYLHRVRGAKLVVYLQDIHPDIAVALGKLRNGPLTRLVRRLLFRVYRGADRVIVLSDDMRRHILESGVDSHRVVCIPNWVDTDMIRPMKVSNAFRQRHDLDGKFVVMYSGNLGLCQRLEDVVEAAGHLRDRSDIVFLFVGEGVSKGDLKARALGLGLLNVRFLGYEPKAKLAESLSAADLHLVPLDPRIASFLMPSKFYGAIASGTPILTIAPASCQLSELTVEHEIGDVARPGEPAALAERIRDLSDHDGKCKTMGIRARRLAEEQYDRGWITAQFRDLLCDLLAIRTTVDVQAPVGLPRDAGDPVPVAAE